MNKALLIARWEFLATVTRRAYIFSVVAMPLLFGIIGALLAIPAAASIQIAIREWISYRREVGVGPDDSAAAGSSRRAEAPT